VVRLIVRGLNIRLRGCLEDLGVDGKIILKWASKINRTLGRGVCSSSYE
jgi:hypothetical protein